jgi:HAD superfamily hydrolase (TIGR01549 family)
LRIKAIFFDLDDTLHDHLKPFANALHSCVPGLNSSLTLYKEFRRMSDLLWEDYSQGILALEELRAQRIKFALESFGVHLSIEDALQFQQQYDKELSSLTLFPDVPALLSQLREAGYELGVITNGPVAHQLNKIKTLGIQEYINKDWLFISDGVGVAKPDPAIFRHVSEKVGIAPADLLYIGDTWANDIKAAIQAGWQAVWFNHRLREPETAHQPLAEIRQLSEILKIVNHQT